MNGVFVDRAERARGAGLPRVHRVRPAFAELACESKRPVMELDASEQNVLAQRLDRISEASVVAGFHLRCSRGGARDIAAFPVYRTYFGERDGDAEVNDRAGRRHGSTVPRRR